jgi:Tfp pilus assembly protein PilO
MTIVQPNKENNVRQCCIHAIFGISAMIVAVLISYLSLVGLRHDLDQSRDSIEQLKVENAELKNEYYQIVSTENLEKLAIERGLVKDKNPEWVLASQSL